MSHVVSVIAANAKAPLTTAHLDQVRRRLHQIGATTGAEVWLSDSEAADLPVQGDPAAILDAARAALGGYPFDVNTLPTLNRRKRLLVADMDSTLIEQECIDELADELGLGEAVSAITAKAMRGEIDFEPALVERVGLLSGLQIAAAERVLAERITLMPGAAALVATMRAAGAYTALVSGGFTVFAGPVAERLGFHEHRANRLHLENAVFQGTVELPILGRKAKEDALTELSSRLGLDTTETLAVGDGANDLGMIQRAGLGVAYRAKPTLRVAADAIIDHGDLTALLFLQGYRRDDFAPEPRA